MKEKWETIFIVGVVCFKPSTEDDLLDAIEKHLTEWLVVFNRGGSLHKKRRRLYVSADFQLAM